ncbi:hypothetical protein E2562_035562 [Oryza meyeriana var. granulata]|uniref:Uncharacterized protein n=1 Tax=Oryza meyeriana var. granulata TaxID=110450 RepID=A0A6G1DS93_9ORYZ|nr:hypothetical protein E2562_035562 [Oryza meyeriana var. granulata]
MGVSAAALLKSLAKRCSKGGRVVIFLDQGRQNLEQHRREHPEVLWLAGVAAASAPAPTVDPDDPLQPTVEESVGGRERERRGGRGYRARDLDAPSPSTLAPPDLWPAAEGSCGGRGSLGTGRRWRERGGPADGSFARRSSCGPAGRGRRQC